MANVTEMLVRWSAGDEEAFDRLVPLVYRELKRLAHARIRQETPGQTLNTTGLVHEAYMKLVDVKRVQWNDRNHFLSMAARTMRRIMIEHARKRSAQRRHGGVRVDLAEEVLLVSEEQATTWLELDSALDGLEAEHPRQSKVLELLYFGGLTQTEVGAVLEVSQPTVARDLRFARAWLARELASGG